MDCFIKKIFQGEADDEIHSEFVKFSRGEFKDRCIIEAKKQVDKWAIKTSSEFANYFVRKCLEKAPEILKIKGIIICTGNIESDIKFYIKDVKKFMGIRKIVIDTELNKADLLELMDKYPRIFYGLSFSTQTCKLKIKEKAPKSGKPPKKGGTEAKADFCTLKTTDFEMIKDLFFDVPDFKEIKISHTIQIIDIIYPQNEQDFEKIRLLARKKGKIIRKVTSDGKETISEKEFEA